jgi:hypothetical protein
MGKKSRKKYQVQKDENTKVEQKIVTSTKEYKRYVPVLIVIGIIIAGALLLRYVYSRPGKHDSLAQCVVDSGTKMYSAWWCTHCQEQKRMFGSSFKIIVEGGAHVECSPGGTQTFSDFCRNAGITSTPTWVFPDGSMQPGRLPIETIAEKSGCNI